MHSASIHPHKNASSANRKRLYWALARIFIGITSTCFFIYFLVKECRSVVVVQAINQTIQVEIDIIDWLGVNGDEVEYSQYLARNITVLPPDPYSNDPLAPVVLSFAKLADVQRQSLSRLRILAESAQQDNMLQGNESTQLWLYIDQVATVQARMCEGVGGSNNGTRVDGGRSMCEGGGVDFSWLWYFQFMDLYHSLRFFMTNVVSRNINYQRQEVAAYSVALTALLYYRENMAMLRDAGLRFYVWPSPDTMDSVVEYNKACKIYSREVSQKNPDDLSLTYSAAESLPQWKYCNNVVEADLQLIHPSYNASSFNQSLWYDCFLVLLHAHRGVREELRQRLVEATQQYVYEVSVGLVVACIGIVLEVLAAGTLIQQAVPVLMLYMKMQTVVKSSVHLSTMGTGDSRGHGSGVSGNAGRVTTTSSGGGGSGGSGGSGGGGGGVGTDSHHNTPNQSLSDLN